MVINNKSSAFINCYTPCDNQYSNICHNGTARKYHLQYEIYKIANKEECPYYICKKGIVIK